MRAPLPCDLRCFSARVPLRSLSTQPPPTPPPPPPGGGGGSTQSVVEIRSAQEFDQLCVAASATPPPVGGPVVLDFYADWCQPCKQLTPKLQKLVEGAQGAVRLAKINVDALPELATALQVASLPTVMLLHGGKLVDSFQGVVPDASLKALCGAWSRSADPWVIARPPASLQPTFAHPELK